MHDSRLSSDELLLRQACREAAIKIGYECRAALDRVRVGGERDAVSPPLPFERGYVLSSGTAGLVPLFHELARVTNDSEWIIAEAEALEATVSYMRTVGSKFPWSLMTGLSGVLMMAEIAGQGEGRYVDLVTGLRKHVEQVFYRHCQSQMVARDFYEYSHYDLVFGLSGLGLALVSGDRTPDSDRVIVEIVRFMTGVIEELTKGGMAFPLNYQSVISPGVRILAHEGPTTDLGMAHGLTGVLAFLLTVNEELDIGARLIRAISILVEWISRKIVEVDGEIVWPGFYTKAEYGGTIRVETRPSWCYGVSGLSSVLLRAWNVTGQRGHLEMARRMAKGLLEPHSMRDMDGGMICHGFSGVLHCSWRNGRRDDDLVWREIAYVMARRTLDCLDGENSFEISKSGFLTGKIGSALALIAFACGGEAKWDRCLGLS